MTKPRTDDALDVEALRARDFPWTREPGVAYLNSGSTGPLPERTRRAVDAFNERRTRPDRISDDALLTIGSRARGLCAGLIGADPDEIALGFNTSFGLNLAAAALDLQPGDRVLLQDGEFPANVYPWLNQERVRGIVVERIPRRPDGLPDEAAAIERLERGGVRAFAVSAVGFSNGFRADLATISRICREQGTYLIVDGIQALGVVPFDVRETPVDIVACGGQKWLLSPWGSGFAYVRRGLIETLRPPVVGWLSFEASQDFGSLTDYRLDPVPEARRFELGTLGFGALVGLSESLSLLLELGSDPIRRHVDGLQRRLVEWVETRDDVEWASDPAAERRSGILAFRPPAAETVYERLRSAGVIVSLRESAIRTSIHAFNSPADIERLIEVTESALADRQPAPSTIRRTSS